MILGHAELLHRHPARCAHAETVDTKHLAGAADILPPQCAHTGLDRDPLGAGLRQNAFAVLVALAVEQFKARNRNHAHTGTQLCGCRHYVLQLRAAGNQNGLQLAAFLLGHIATAQHSVATRVD